MRCLQREQHNIITNVLSSVASFHRLNTVLFVIIIFIGPYENNNFTYADLFVFSCFVTL